MTKLSVVATPIGNLEDVTYRAVRVLGEADVVLCEDTRITRRLLDAYDISAELLSYHAKSGQVKTDRVVALLADGKHLALVSDAGTPAISDPGAKLVSTVREHFGREVTIEVIPGPSAVTAALSIAGVPASDFLFLGFLPHKKGRETLFAAIADSTRTVIFYESPHRIEKTLARLHELLDEARIVTVVREATKRFEHVYRGSAQAVLEQLTEEQAVRGEFVVIVS
jgi:16S rRNA (cytidine1402-2'-O)-methyltransferase